MTQWRLEISEETDESVRNYLARTRGQHGDLSAFVDRCMRQAVFWATVRDIKERNAGQDPAELQAAIDQAIDETRAGRS